MLYFFEHSAISGENVRSWQKKLNQRFGDPVFRDSYIQVWSLRGGEPGAAADPSAPDEER
jgi:hypothetical protein